MLPLMKDLCKACAKARSFKAKLALRERLIAVQHLLMTEALAEYQAEIAAAIDIEAASDDYFDLKGFLIDCERGCFKCNNSEQANVYLVIQEYLEQCHGDEQPPEKKDPPDADAVPKPEDGQAAPKAPANLADYRLRKGRKGHKNDT